MAVARYSPALHYPIVSKWWEAHKWPPLPPEFLPQIGFVAFHDAAPVCACWLYRTDSAFALIEYVISDPESDKGVRSAALDELLEAAVRTAKEMGFGALFTSAQHPGLLERYRKAGFVETDKGMTNMIGKLR